MSGKVWHLSLMIKAPEEVQGVYVLIRITLLLLSVKLREKRTFYSLLQPVTCFKNLFVLSWFTNDLSRLFCYSFWHGVHRSENIENMGFYSCKSVKCRWSKLGSLCFISAAVMLENEIYQIKPTTSFKLLWFIFIYNIWHI